MSDEKTKPLSHLETRRAFEKRECDLALQKMRLEEEAVRFYLPEETMRTLDECFAVIHGVLERAMLQDLTIRVSYEGNVTFSKRSFQNGTSGEVSKGSTLPGFEVSVAKERTGQTGLPSMALRELLYGEQGWNGPENHRLRGREAKERDLLRRSAGEGLVGSPESE